MNATIPTKFTHEKANLNNGTIDDQICINPFKINSKGVWFGDHPFEYTMPVLMLNLCLIMIISHAIHLLLKPFRQPLFISQILVGFILGPSWLGSYLRFKESIFPRSGTLLLEIFAMFGLMFFNFLYGVKMDLSMVLKAGKKVIAMSVLCFFLPYTVGKTLAHLLSKLMGLDQNFSIVLDIIARINSSSSVLVISCFLVELKILNSELGRLSISSSMIVMICNMFMRILNDVITTAKNTSIIIAIRSMLMTAVYMALCLYSTRKLALMIIKHTPEGKPVKESYVFGIIILILGFGLISQILSFPYYLLPFYLGLAIPDGPPLGSCLEEKLESCISAIFLQIFFATCGLKTDISLPDAATVCLVLLIIVVSFLAKSIGIILPALYFRMPFQDAISLALIMNSKGITELTLYNGYLQSKEIPQKVFAITITSVVVMAGVTAPLVRYLYDPSRRYLTYKKRTILHTGTNTGLGILACVHTPDNVPPIIKLLEASNPTKQSPINVCVLHLVELVGRNSSVLIHHRRNTRSYAKCTTSEYIIKTFRNYEKQNQGIVTVDAFTSIAPFITMHDDVCWLALEERTSFVIISFHRQWLATGKVESSTAIRNLNNNVIDKAPCSVGILIDHNHFITSSSQMKSTSLYRVGILFIGGSDDQEALSYALRMAEKPSISLTVIGVSSKDSLGDNVGARMLDNNMLDNFKTSTLHNDRVRYQEEEVSDGSGFLSIIRSMENSYDLIMVGRRHEESRLTVGLTEWSEYPELGVIGDIIASPDFKGMASVLVVQQQARVRGTPADD